ncbi:MAG TPA: hypothetical protein VLE46_00830 [Nitrospira sp.]|nr:hypothetical protein [Nitrospira sp.]
MAKVYENAQDSLGKVGAIRTCSKVPQLCTVVHEQGNVVRADRRTGRTRRPHLRGVAKFFGALQTVGK